MILESEVASTYKAYKPEATPEEIKKLFEEIQDVERSRKYYWEAELKRAWRKAHRGENPGFLETWAILDQAAQHAEMQVRGEYLEPMTQQIVAWQLEDEEAEEEAERERLRQEALTDPDLWWQEPWRIQPSDDAKDLADWIWPEATVRFGSLARNLVARREHLGLPIPWQYLEIPVDPSDPLYQELTREIADAEIRSNKEDAEIDRRVALREQQNQQ